MPLFGWLNHQIRCSNTMVVLSCGKQLVRDEIEKGKLRELTVQEALPPVEKILLKAQDQMRD